MYRSLRNFFVALGFACYFTQGGVAIAKNTESWLAPVCYHDLPEYGNYRWNCLVPPPPVPDAFPASAAPEELSAVAPEYTNLPEHTNLPEFGEPPMPVAPVLAEVSGDFADPEHVAPIEQPAYFSATDIRRRDWWTPTFVVNDSPLVTPPVVDESCHTQWYGCEEEAMDSYAELEAAMFADHETSTEEAQNSPIVEDLQTSLAALPPECIEELVAAEWMLVEEAMDLAAKIDMSVLSGYAADAISTTAPWFANREINLVEEVVKSDDALADELFVNAEEEQDLESAPGFTAYTCMIPYSLTANVEESSANYAQQDTFENDLTDDRVETAAAMQKLARQLDWVGLNILRMADHLDSWANQALLRHRAGQIR